MFVWVGPNCSTWGRTHCGDPDDRTSTAARLDGHAADVITGLDLGKLSRPDGSSWGKDPKRLCKGDTMGLVTVCPFESEKLCCWHSEGMAWKGDDRDCEAGVYCDMADTPVEIC